MPADAAGLVVAISGGADSSALLRAAAALGKAAGALPLRALHIDHGLQASAADFRAACARLCAELSIPLHTVAVEVPREGGVSIEAAARAARYAAFAADMQPRECLLTAHHREDQAETFLLQALRGAGVKGMSAMPICRALGRGWHVRPLLEVAHADLLKFCELDPAASIDPMNQDLKFDRVYLRTMVWPPMKTRWPGAAIALARAARHMAEAQQLLEAAASADVARLRDGDALSISGLRTLPPLKRVGAVRLWLNQEGLEVPSTTRLAEALRQMFDADADHQPSVVLLSSAAALSSEAIRNRGRVAASAGGAVVERRGRLIGRAGPGAGKFDVDRLAGRPCSGAAAQNVTVRRRGGGETLKPAASAKTQTVQHLCQTLGVLPWMREALPLVFSGDELIAVADLWLDASWCAPASAPGLGIAWNHAPPVT